MGELAGLWQLMIKDVSSNGSGVEMPGEELVQIPKDTDTPVKDGAIVVMPMRVKKAKKDTPASIRYIIRCDSGPWAFKSSEAKSSEVVEEKKASAPAPVESSSSDESDKKKVVAKEDDVKAAASRAAAAALAGGADSSDMEIEPVQSTDK